MSSVNLRRSVRAVVLDEESRILLCRSVIPEPAGTIVVWVSPGGGREGGETILAALRRELHEEVGLAIAADPPHVWHQEVIDPGHAVGYEGYDGVVNDYFRWWQLRDIAGYRGSDLFSPRDLATPLAALIVGGAPARPVPLGL